MDAYLPSDYQEFVLIRTHTGLGFNIRGGTDHPYYKHDTGIFVTKVHPGGAAHSDGRLQVGDKICEINGQNLINVKHNDAVENFKAAGKEVKLRIIPAAKIKKPATAAPIVPVAIPSAAVDASQSQVKSPEPAPAPAIPEQPSQESFRSEDKQEVPAEEPEKSGGMGFVIPGILGLVAVGLIGAFAFKKYQQSQV